MWRESFPYVKIRSYKQVTGNERLDFYTYFVANIFIKILSAGKCYPCLLFSFLCGKYRDGKRREIIRELQVLHQATYMGERFDYYRRREDSLSHPTTFLSDISDEMSGTKHLFRHSLINLNSQIL
jgi:hypothetical protein